MKLPRMPGKRQWRMRMQEGTLFGELENERRAKSEERAQRLAEHTRLKAQFGVLEQAEQSLAGYAEGARFLLDAARQSRLRGARGALSASLDVPVELEQAVTAALGDSTGCHPAGCGRGR